MIGKHVRNVDSLINKHFREKRPLLIMILAGQALLIGLLTFFCLTKDGSDYCQAEASQSMILLCGFFNNLLKIKYHVVGCLKWILGCGGDGEEQVVKILSPPDLVDDDAVCEIIQAVLLLLIPLVLLTILVILVCKSITNKSDETILNNEEESGNNRILFRKKEESDDDSDDNKMDAEPKDENTGNKILFKKEEDTD